MVPQFVIQSKENLRTFKLEVNIVCSWLKRYKKKLKY